MPPSSPLLTVVSQHITHTHGQGNINLELITRLVQRGRRIEAVASNLDESAKSSENIRWRRVITPAHLPTNWLRCELFRHSAERIVRRARGVVINNGAAAVAPSRMNIAMFVHSAWLASPFGPRNSNGLHARFLSAFHCHQSKLERRAFQQADLIVALSDSVRDELVEHCGINPKVVHTIPPGVDSNRYRPLPPGANNPLRRACRIDVHDDRMLALFVGEIRSRRKNLDLLLHEASRRPDMLVAVLGDTKGSPYPELSRAMGVTNRVFFLGHRSDVDRLMPGADVFVFPTHYEPFGLVVTEAMASGLPVVVTRQAGSAGIVKQGVNGFLLEDGFDSDGLAEAISVLSDPTIRTAWGTAARRDAERLTWDAMTDRYVDLLDSCD